MSRLMTISSFTIVTFLTCSCSALSPQPTVTPTITITPTSTSTTTPTNTPTDTPITTETPTSTPSPTLTPEPPTLTPTQEDLLEQPQDTPLGQWRGIPVMPGAISGEETSYSYAYIISESPAQVQGFYERELLGLGWGLLASGVNEENAIVLVFIQGFRVMSVSILLQGDGTTYVLLLQS